MSLIRIRLPYPFEQGTPSFDVGEAFALVMTAFVALAEVNLAMSASIPPPTVAALYHFPSQNHTTTNRRQTEGKNGLLCTIFKSNPF
ncbi:hypothetical protein L1887_13465 [Cichorium endivia]|nr:hypothetical protein L1887_13465 [Cichorium endivia]